MQRLLLKFWRVITPGPTQRLGMSAHIPRPMSPLAACEPSAGQRMLGMRYWKLFAHMLKFLFESGPGWEPSLNFNFTASGTADFANGATGSGNAAVVD